MSLVATIRALVAAGATPEVILAAVEAMEGQREDALQRRRDADAKRQQKKRSANVRVVSRDVTLPVNGHADTTPRVGAGAPVVIPFSSSLRSEEVGGGGVSAGAGEPVSDDWPDGKASDHADLLVQAVASPWLDPTKSPDLVTTRGRVAAWKREGASWEHDVLPVVTGLCANRRSRISTWKFFDPAISRSIADNRAALEIPEANRSTGPPKSFLAEQSAIAAEARRRVLESD